MFLVVFAVFAQTNCWFYTISLKIIDKFNHFLLEIIFRFGKIYNCAYVQMIFIMKKLI